MFSLGAHVEDASGTCTDSETPLLPWLPHQHTSQLPKRFAILPPPQRGVKNQSREKETKKKTTTKILAEFPGTAVPGWPPAQVNTSYHC